MKATAEQLARVNFDKFRNSEWAARFDCPTINVWHRCALVAHFELQLGKWTLKNMTADALADVSRKLTELEAFIASEIAALDLAEKRERTKPEPGEGYEYCRRDDATSYSFWDGNSWSVWVGMSGPHHYVDIERYIFRRPKRFAPKPLTVKAPEGCWWEADPRYGIRLAWSESPGCTSYKYVPRDTAAAERGKAVNAAFDEANGSRFVQIEDFISSTTTYRPVHDSRSPWVHHVKLGSGIEFDVSEPHRFKFSSRVRVTIEELPETPKPA